MGFGDVSTPTYVSIKKDTSFFSVKRQVEEAFTTQSVSGFLVGIDYINATFENKPAPKLSMKFIDHESGEEFMFQTSFNGGYAMTILNCLSSVEHEKFGVIGLMIVEKDKKARLQVYHNKMYLSWKYKEEEMPAPKELRKDDGSVLKDYSKRTLWFKDTVLADVQSKLPERYQRQAMVESHVEKQRVLPPAPPAHDDIQWGRPPVAALPERSAASDFVPFPTSTGNVNVPRNTSRIVEAEVIPPPTDDDRPY